MGLNIFFKKTFSTIIILFSVAAASSPNFPAKPYEFKIDSAWKKVNSPAGQIFPDNYVYSKNENMKLNIMYNMGNKAGIPVTEKNQIHPDFLAGRKKMNDVMGVKNWVISQHDVQKKDKMTVLLIIGSYTDALGVSKKFEERHYFLSEKYVVARISYDEKNKDPKALSLAKESLEKLKMR